MPLYEYECLECGAHFDVRQSLNPHAAVSPVVCPNGHRSARRLLSRPAIIFKGSGFYATDHPRNGSGRTSTDRQHSESPAPEDADHTSHPTH